MYLTFPAVEKTPYGRFSIGKFEVSEYAMKLFIFTQRSPHAHSCDTFFSDWWHRVKVQGRVFAVFAVMIGLADDL
jgi:hypothetical protein